MSIETLTYALLGARLGISPEAARSLAKRLQLPRSLSDDGKALVSVDLAEIRHTPRPPSGRQAGNIALLAAKIEALKAEVARLEARVADHRADFERERERADRLRRWHGLKVMWRLCGPVAEPAARSTAKAKLHADWGI
jgi:hypothetical protein